MHFDFLYFLLFFINCNSILPAMTDAIMSNMTNLNKSEIKDEQVNDLMKSIENKLSMLACDDSVNNF